MHCFAKLILTIGFCAVLVLVGGHQTARAGTADQSVYDAEASCNSGAATTGKNSSIPPTAAVSLGCTFSNTQKSATVQGVIYVDTNGNGQHEPGEGVEGVTVSLSAQYISIATLVLPLTTVTGPDGSYRFQSVLLREYTLLVTLPGDSQPVYSQTVNVGAEPVTSVDPIAVTTGTQKTATVQGVIYVDTNGNDQHDADEGVGGVTVVLSAQYVSIATLVFPLTTVTGVDGSYTFDGVPLGTYTLLVTLPGDSQPVYSQMVNVGAEPVTSVDPIAVTTGTQKTATVQGVIYVDTNGNGQHEPGEGVEGITVSLSAQYISIATLVFPLTTVTGVDGSYTFDGVPLGTYMLLVTLPGDSQPVYSQTVNVGMEPVTSVDPIAISLSRAIYLPAIAVTPVQATPVAYSHRQYLPSLLFDRCLYSYSSPFGVQMYGQTGSASPYYPALRQSGASWVRVAIAWSSVEPQNTTPDKYRWSNADAAVAAASEACLSLIVTHVSAPSWAATNADGEIDIVSLDEFEEYMAALVERYDGDGIADAPNSPVVNHWELYNEPDDRTRWGNKGEKYVQMLAAVYPAIKKANPKAQVLIGGLALDWFVDDTENPGVFVRSFLDDVLSNGGGQYFDIMNIHAYPGFAKEWTDSSGPGLREKVDFVRNKLLDEYGLDKLFMITEAGWHSNAYFEYSSTLEKQSRYAVQLYTHSLVAQVEVMIYWMLHDLSDSYPFKPGLVTYAGAIVSPLVQKPVFKAYQVISTLLSDVTYEKDLNRDEREAYLFSDPYHNRSIYVAWLNPIDTTEVVSLGVSAEKATLWDIYGNATDVFDEDDGSNDGRIKVRITSQPVYIFVNN